MIAAVTAYALVVQVLLAALGNGAALVHAFDGVSRGVLCVSADIGADAAPGPSDDGAGRTDLCCLAPVLVGTMAPVLAVGPLVPTLRMALASAVETGAAAIHPAEARARAPPGIV